MKSIVLAIVSLVLAAPAPAAVIERLRIADNVPTAHYPRSLAVVLQSPDAYVRERTGPHHGEWRGPRYRSTVSPSFGGTAVLDWAVLTYEAPATGATFLKNRAQSWAVAATGVESVERRVGARVVGAVRAQWILTIASDFPGEARYEAGLVLPLCGRAGVVRLAALVPSSDNGHAVGDAQIEGMPPSQWNRLQVLETFARARLEGNLPAARLTAGPRGRSVAGRVTDCNGHALAGARVALERRSGRAWVPAGASKTSTRGAYSLRAAKPGTYRVVAGGKRSGAVRVG